MLSLGDSELIGLGCARGVGRAERAGTAFVVGVAWTLRRDPNLVLPGPAAEVAT